MKLILLLTAFITLNDFVTFCLFRELIINFDYWDHNTCHLKEYRDDVRCRRVFVNFLPLQYKYVDRFQIRLDEFMPEYYGVSLLYRWHKTYEYGKHFLMEYYGDSGIYNKCIILFYLPTKMARIWFSFVKNGHFYAFNVQNMMYWGEGMYILYQQQGPRISREEFLRLQTENRKSVNVTSRFHKKHFGRRSFQKQQV